MTTGLRILTVIFIQAVFIQSTFSQNYTTLKNASKKTLSAYNEATKDIMQGYPEEAEKKLEQLTDSDPKFIDVWILLGELQKEKMDFENGSKSLEKAISIDPNYSSKAYFFLAECYWSLDSFDECRNSAEEFLAFPDISKQRKAEAERMVVNSQFASGAMKNPVPFNPETLGNGINSQEMEYLPSLTGDEQTIVFTRRVGTGRNANEDFYTSHKMKDGWSASQPLEDINSFYNEGAQSISPDGRSIYYVVCDKPGGYGGCDIYFTMKKGNEWISSSNVGAPVCTNGWETQPSISADDNSLFFVSTRTSGKGGSDIWVSSKDKNGKWKAPLNLGDSINTSMDEKSPFIHPDGRTIYFSSNGHPGMGKDDIFYSRKRADGNWSKPINLGYPINTKNDENSFVVSLNGQHGYFSSDRFKQNRDMDLYQFNLYEEARPFRVTYLKGIVTDAVTANPLMADIQLIDLENGILASEAKSDPVNGNYLVSIPEGKNYALNVSAPGYLFYSENFTLLNRTDSIPFLINVEMQPVEVGSRVVLRNIFFETDSYVLRDDSKVELQKLIELLSQNAAINIQISGHTDNQGNVDYNLKLSQNRAKAVYEFLISNGIDQKRLSYIGFGESKPVTSNESEDGRALNRRTEFMITSL